MLRNLHDFNDPELTELILKLWRPLTNRANYYARNCNKNYVDEQMFEYYIDIAIETIWETLYKARQKNRCNANNYYKIAAFKAMQTAYSKESESRKAECAYYESLMKGQKQDEGC